MIVATMSTVFNEEVGKLDLFQFSRREDGGLNLLWREGQFVNEIALGMDGHYAVSPVQYGPLHLNACTKATWINSYHLRVLVRMREACVVRQLDFDFADEKSVTVRNRSFPDLPNLAAYYVDFSGIVLPKQLDDLLVNVIAPAILLLGEPDFHLKRG